MLVITSNLTIPASEIKISFIRAPGPGGQNVNKVATGVQLRFNVKSSQGFPDEIRECLIAKLKSKLTISGDLIIKASRYRTQNLNKQDALERLQALIQKAIKPVKKRKKTKPTLAVKERRLTSKKLHSKTKSLRRKDPKND